jgi:hypothetical protein
MPESEEFQRSEALDKALAFWGPGAAQNPALVLETAEKFRAFLAGDGAKPEPSKAKDERLAFRLPRRGDGYVYFRFGDSHILYRSLATSGSLVKSVARISTLYDVNWEPATGSLATRHGLRNADGYDEIGAEAAALVIRKHMTGVRFE